LDYPSKFCKLKGKKHPLAKTIFMVLKIWISIFLFFPLSLFSQEFAGAFNTSGVNRKIISCPSGNYYTMGDGICKYNKDKKLIWKKEIQTLYHSYLSFLGMVIDDKGHIYFTGRYAKECTYEGIQFTSSMGGSFLIKINTDGELIWYKNIPYAGVNACFIKNGLFYFSGHLQDDKDIFFDNFLLRNETDGMHGFLVCYNLSGTCIWAVNSLASTSNVIRHSITCVENEIIIIGNFFGINYPFLQSFGSEDIWIIKHDSIGKIKWMTTAGGNSQDFVTGITLDSKGNI
jgi:hypothetical protein